MANVSRPVSLYSATDYAVQGLKKQESPVVKPEEKPKKPVKKKPPPKKKPVAKKKPVPKSTTKKISEANRKKLLPWM